MVEIIEFITSHWIAWLFSALVSVGTYIIGKVLKRLEEKLDEEHSRQGKERQKNDDIAMGVQCLLRDSIVSSYNKYTERGYCPIYAKESLKKIYTAYHNLEGNDVATKLYNKQMDMPEECPAEREE